MTTAKHTLSTVLGKTIDYIEVDIGACNTELLSTYSPHVYKELNTSTKFGINGTFFDDATLVTACITWGPNCTALGPNGAVNATYTRGTLVLAMHSAQDTF
jgi:hypothetical protein